MTFFSSVFFFLDKSSNSLPLPPNDEFGNALSILKKNRYNYVNEYTNKSELDFCKKWNIAYDNLLKKMKEPSLSNNIEIESETQSDNLNYENLKGDFFPKIFADIILDESRKSQINFLEKVNKLCGKSYNSNFLYSNGFRVELYARKQTGYFFNLKIKLFK